MSAHLKNKSILLVIAGGIAAYKSLELIRLIRKSGGHVRCILTKGGEKFVTPLSIAALSEEEVYTDLWSLKDETEMGHIRLSREADLIVVAPASADLIAKMANGFANDLASTALLAADKPILIAPAMNHRMWHHPAVQENMSKLLARGVRSIGPHEGDMACGEYGMGRMAEPEEIFSAISGLAAAAPLKKNLSGLKALVTAGPTHEPIDPVRFIGNRSSGKQGYAIAAALAELGAEVTLISGPVTLPAPPMIRRIEVQTAQEMLRACEDALPADIAICAAAVSDWSPAASQDHKIKKRQDQSPPALALKENPDILKTLSHHKKRPGLVVGFAAETEDLLANAREKLKRKGCDWIIANSVEGGKTFGADQNHVYLVNTSKTQEWPRASKAEIAQKLAAAIAAHFEGRKESKDAAE